MTRAELESLLDLILNKASIQDLKVAQEAIKRRWKDLNSVGSPRFDPLQVSKKLAAGIQHQLGATREAATAAARRTIEEMICQKVPDIPKEHLDALLAEWVPSETEKIRKKKTVVSPLPAEALTVMVRDFVAFGAGTMTATRQVELHDQLPHWQEAYWRAFPDRVQRLIHLFFDGKVPLEVFWKEIAASLEVKNAQDDDSQEKAPH